MSLVTNITSAISISTHELISRESFDRLTQCQIDKLDSVIFICFCSSLVLVLVELCAKPSPVWTLLWHKKQRRICVNFIMANASSHWTCAQRRLAPFVVHCHHVMPTAKQQRNSERDRSIHNANMLLKHKYLSVCELNSVFL